MKLPRRSFETDTHKQSNALPLHIGKLQRWMFFESMPDAEDPMKEPPFLIGQNGNGLIPSKSL